MFRSFYRALKARVMSDSNPIPIQVIRRHTYVEADAKQSEATRAWNLAVSLYYKSGRIPWRPTGLPADTCFVGISFHHLKRRAGEIVYASVAQAFSNEIDPFAFKGASIPPDQKHERQPYLTEDQAAELVGRVIDAYEAQTGIPPPRVVIHKTSRYEPEEEEVSATLPSNGSRPAIWSGSARHPFACCGKGCRSRGAERFAPLVTANTTYSPRATSRSGMSTQGHIFLHLFR